MIKTIKKDASQEIEKGAAVILPPAGFGAFNLMEASEKIIKKHYKAPDSARKIRAFLKYVDEAFHSFLMSEQAPAHMKRDEIVSTIYSMTMEEITEALMEKNRTINSPNENSYQALLTDAAVAKEGFINFIRADRKRMRTLWYASRFLEFNFEELATKKGWNWLLKIAVHQEMKKVHHSYDIRLVLSPEKHWHGISVLEDEIQELQMNPQLALDIDGEKNAKIEQRRARVTERETQWIERMKACPDIKFEGRVREVSYRDIKIWDEGEGESTTIPGTILTLKIPGSTVEELNAIRGAIDDYHIRLQPVS